MSDDGELQVRGVSAGYGTVHALRDIDIEVRAGEIVGVIGPNGAGKSTLLATVAGLVRPRAGEIWAKGRRLDGHSAEQIFARGVCLVPERGRPFARLTVEENLRAVVVRGRSERQRRITEIYERFPDLRRLRTQRAGSLSGGERQQLALGRALISRPSLLLLDEPSLGLAPLVVREVFALLPNLCAHGTAVVVAEQRLHELLRVANRVYALVAGRIELEVDPRAPTAEEQLVATYFGERIAHSQPVAPQEMAQ